MLVLNQDYSLAAANMSVTVTDNTTVQTTTEESQYPVPNFNIFVPTFQDIGPTNVIELYRPGYQATYAALHGMPNALKYGFGPDIIYDTLAQNAGVGVYTVNLRGADATVANVMALCDYTIKEESYVDPSTGEQQYLLPDGTMTSDSAAEGAVAVSRKVLHVKYRTENLEGIHSWLEMVTKLNASGVPASEDETTGETSGTIPLFAVTYRGNSNFGNNAYFSMNPVYAEYDGKTYYSITAFDGLNTITSDDTLSLDNNSGVDYGTTYFIETQFNDTFHSLRFSMYEGIDELYDLYNKYLLTVGDYIAAQTDPSVGSSVKFAEIDPFSYGNSDNPAFAVVIDDGSIVSTKTNAFSFAGGDNGTADFESLLIDMFNGKILDMRSVLRYKITYVPDVGYSDEVKTAIVGFIKARNRFTSASIEVGSNTFTSAMNDHATIYFDDMPNIRQLAKVQSPMRYNPYCRRTIKTPASYFDTMELVRQIGVNGHPFQPFAGARTRWSGFIEDTMPYPSETPELINALVKNRINFVMKDNMTGAYMSDQLMNTVNASDQTEFNNAMLISTMLYDLLDLVHANHFKFNEEEEVKQFSALVDEHINTKYTKYSASLITEVYRNGTVGRARYTNTIRVTIDLKDINRYTNVEIVLVDE